MRTTSTALAALLTIALSLMLASSAPDASADTPPADEAAQRPRSATATHAIGSHSLAVEDARLACAAAVAGVFPAP